MKTINYCIVVIFLFILPKFCFSQDYNSTVFFHSESFGIIKTKYFNLNPFSQYGIGLQAKFSNNLILGVYTSQWANGIIVNEYGNEKIDTALSCSPFHLTGRNAYAFIDGNIGYLLHKGTNEFVIVGGITYANGYNEYTKIYWNSSWYNGQFYIHDGVGYSELIKFTSWGINSKLYYNRYFYQRRFNVGIQTGFRYLFEYPKPQIEVGLHIGYNFSLFNKLSNDKSNK